MKVVAGKYRIERVLGEGGMGTVLAATHLTLERPVALKILRAGGDARSTERLLREARAVATLRSEHVVAVTDCGTAEDGSPYLAMELLEGCDLGSYLEEHGPLSLDEACTCIVHACEGLAEAHARGIVHRDVKPRNLFRTRRVDGRVLVKVLDFGIAKRTVEADADPCLTRDGEAVGSPAYMSPEQLRGAPLDARTDVWSLGAVLYELLTGRLPFEGASLAVLRERVLEPLAHSLQALRQDVPDAVARIVGRCLEPATQRRVADVAELAEALAPFASPTYGDVTGAPQRARAILDRHRCARGDGASADATSPGAPAPTDLRSRSHVTASFHPSALEGKPTPTGGRPWGAAVGALALGLLVFAGVSRMAKDPGSGLPPLVAAASAPLSSTSMPPTATSNPPLPTATPSPAPSPTTTTATLVSAPLRRPAPQRSATPTATAAPSAPEAPPSTPATAAPPLGLPAVRR